MAIDEDEDDPRSVAAALQWAKWVLAVEADQREEEEQVLRFQDAEGAWDPAIREFRNATTINNVPVPARPMISVATLDEPIGLQQSYERTATLSPRIHALSEDATDATAKVIADLYRAIERDSNAQVARRWAYDRALWCGRGYWRVDVCYDASGGHPLDQKIVIKRILDQSHVLLDPAAQEPDKSDGLHAMILYDLPRDIYRRRYGASKLAKAESDQITELEVNEDTRSWVFTQGEGGRQTRMYRVAEEWVVEIDQIPQMLLDDNSVADRDKIPPGRVPHPTDTRELDDREERHVYCRTINAIEELEPWSEWDGRYIPIIPALGRELQLYQGKRRVFGMVQNARGAVRLTNYAASGAIEMAALEPKAPWLIEEGVDEGFQHEYQAANIRNFPALHFKSTNSSGQRATPPARVQVDVSRLGPNLQLLQLGQSFVQSATATHPPALGENTPAFRSGKAITALQSQSFTANAPYLDNFANISMMYEAKVILDLLPSKYDRPGRIARLLGVDGTSRLVALNQPFIPPQNGGRPQMLPYATPEEQQAAQQAAQNPKSPVLLYDLRKGQYGLMEVTIGKSYADERIEGLTEMGTILQSDPSFAQLVGPEYFEYRGEKWADKVAAILKKNRDHLMPWLSDDPQQAQNVQQLQMQIQQLQQQLGQLQMERQGKMLEQAGKLQVAQTQEQAESDRNRMNNETKLAVAAISAKVETLQNMMDLFVQERARLGTQGHELALGAAEHHAALQQGAQQQQAAQQQQQQGAIQTAAQSGIDQANTLQQGAQQAALSPQPGGGASGGPVSQ